jgi:hypothetical protein
MSKPLQHQPNGFLGFNGVLTNMIALKDLTKGFNYFTKYINVSYIIPYVTKYFLSFSKLVCQTTLSMKSQCLECVGSFHQILLDLVSWYEWREYINCNGLHSKYQFKIWKIKISDKLYSHKSLLINQRTQNIKNPKKTNSNYIEKFVRWSKP